MAEHILDVDGAQVRFLDGPFYLLSNLLTKLVNKKDFYSKGNRIERGKEERMKRYLLLIEDEELWEKFKENIEKDINTEIMELIKERAKGKGGKNK